MTLHGRTSVQSISKIDWFEYIIKMFSWSMILEKEEKTFVRYFNLSLFYCKIILVINILLFMYKIFSLLVKLMAILFA